MTSQNPSPEREKHGYANSRSEDFECECGRRFDSPITLYDHIISQSEVRSTEKHAWNCPKQIFGVTVGKDCPHPDCIAASKGITDQPHSRACGWQEHSHGTACHPNCPTCAVTAALSPQPQSKPAKADDAHEHVYRCQDCDQLGTGLPTQSNPDIEVMLDGLGFASKPGSTKGRQYSSRFYHAELKAAIQAYVDVENRKAWDEGNERGYEAAYKEATTVERATNPYSEQL